MLKPPNPPRPLVPKPVPKPDVPVVVPVPSPEENPNPLFWVLLNNPPTNEHTNIGQCHGAVQETESKRPLVVTVSILQNIYMDLTVYVTETFIRI